MSSSAGLSSYSSLFTAGLDPTGRLPASSRVPRDIYGHQSQHSTSRIKDFPSNVNPRRPSADTESSNSRRSSLPADSRYRSTGAYSHNGSAGSNASVTGIPFTPSTLLRSDTNATKRSHYKSFLSMDANDRYSTVPPLPSTNNARPNGPQQEIHAHTRAISVSSSTWAPSLQSPFYANFIGAGNLTMDSVLESQTPSGPENASQPNQRRSTSQSLHDYSAPQQPTRDTSSPHGSQFSSDQPPRLDVSLDSWSSRLSFDPSATISKHTSTSTLTSATPATVPTRPQYEPRVRSSLPSTSSVSMSPPPDSGKRGIQRNMSIASASTFQSMSPSQRSVIRRTRRNEALARLEGNHYDPAPHVQANGSFMPFESDDEDEGEETEGEAGGVTSPKRLHIVTQGSPPAIKPPSPLRHRNKDQRKFLEMERSELGPGHTLGTIVEAPLSASAVLTPTAAVAPNANSSKLTGVPATREYVATSKANQAPPMVAHHQSIWPSLDIEEGEEEDDGDEESDSLTHEADVLFSKTPQQHPVWRTRAVTGAAVAKAEDLGPSPLSSRTNLTNASGSGTGPRSQSPSHSAAMKSQTSLGSFTPFSTVETRGWVAGSASSSRHNHHQQQHSGLNTPGSGSHQHGGGGNTSGLTPLGGRSKAGSFTTPATSRSVSIRSNSHDDASVESNESMTSENVGMEEVSLGLNRSRSDRGLVVDRGHPLFNSSSSSFGLDTAKSNPSLDRHGHVLASVTNNPITNSISPSQYGWASPLSPTYVQDQGKKSSKSKEPKSKSKRPDFQYENWLDM
ncbi:hypothetical protein FRC18_010530, partial [Serendipita sp. 400]